MMKNNGSQILKNCIIKNKFQIMMKNNGSQIDLKLFETFFVIFFKLNLKTYI